MPIQRALTYGLCAILFTAPLPFGSVQPEATALLVAACCALGVLWVIWRSRRGLSPLPWRDPVLAAGALIALLGVLQTVPLPRPLLEKLSPRAVELRERYEPAAASPADDHGHRPISLYPWATRQATLRFAGCWLALLVTLDLAAVGSTHRTLATALVAAGGFQAIYGLAEYLSGHQQIFGYEKKWYTDVATGTFINRNHFAGFLEMTIPLAVALAATSWSRLSTSGKNLGRRLANAQGRDVFRTSMLFILTLIMTTALVCSRSRMGIASTLMASLAVGLFLASRGRGKGFMVAAVVVAGATILLFSQGGAGDSLVGRFLGAPADLQGGVGRWTIWSQTLSMIKAFPVAGVGLGAFAEVFPVFRTAGEGIYLDHAHNDFLEFAAEAGEVGCAVLLLVAFLVFRSMRTVVGGRRDFGLFWYAAIGSVVAIALHSITDFNLTIPSNALTFSVLLGIVICGSRSPAPVLALDRERQRPWIKPSLLPGVAMAGIAAMALAPLGGGARGEAEAATTDASLASVRIDDGHREPLPKHSATWLRQGDAGELFETAADVAAGAFRDLQVLIDSKTAGDKPSRASVDYVESRLREAISLQSLALSLRPTSSAGHVALGHMRGGRCVAESLIQDSDVVCVEDAMQEFRLALELNPVSATTHAQVATFLVSSWPVMDPMHRAEALPIIERAMKLNDRDRSLKEQWKSVLSTP